LFLDEHSACLHAYFDFTRAAPPERLPLLKCTALKEGYGEVGGFSKSTKTTDGYEKGVTHRFDYALAPHAGDWRQAQLYRRGMEFNRPLLPVKAGKHPGRLPQRLSLWSVSAENVVVSAVRATPQGAECAGAPPGPLPIVLRVYEAEGRAVRGVTLRSAYGLASAVETNLIEKEARPAECVRVPRGPLPLDGGLDEKSLSFDLGPFEIKTFRVAPATP